MKNNFPRTNRFIQDRLFFSKKTLQLNSKIRSLKFSIDPNRMLTQIIFESINVVLFSGIITMVHVTRNQIDRFLFSNLVIQFYHQSMDFNFIQFFFLVHFLIMISVFFLLNDNSNHLDSSSSSSLSLL